MPAVVALSGRRIDAAGAAPARFPLDRVPEVTRRLEALLAERAPAHLVCSAACGVDLLALDAAGRLGIARRIVLPFDEERFRASSVADRPGAWGRLFDRIVEEACSESGVLVLSTPATGTEAFQEAALVVLDEAERIAGGATGVLVVIGWDGAARGPGDVTVGFAAAARARGLAVAEISTL